MRPQRCHSLFLRNVATYGKMCAMKEALTFGGILFCVTTMADVAFDVGRWRVSFTDEGARLSLAHVDGMAFVEGTLVFEGPAAVTVEEDAFV